MLMAVVACFALTGCGSSTPPANPAPSASANTGRIIPTWVDVPSIGARSSLVQLGLNPDRTVQVPPVSQPLQAGWYKYSPTPGQVGPAVILGHIDGDHKKGIFWKLSDVKVGDSVEVGRATAGTLTFTVTKVDEIAKSSFPTNAVYGNTSDPQLRLITCGGSFDAAKKSYRDNIIVYAKLKAA